MKNLALLCFVPLLLVALPSAAQEQTSLQLKNAVWEQLVLPGDASGGSLREYLGDDLPASGYGASWVLYGFDPQSGNYFDPGIDGSLEAGTGFWILQQTGQNVVIDLPSNFPDADIVDSNACASEEGCAPVSVKPGNGVAAWNMIGAPFRVPTPVSQIRVAASGGPCAGGCTLDAAAAAGVVGDNYWHFDSDRGEYVDLKEGRSLAPLQGGWLLVSPNVSSGTTSVLYPCVPDA